MNIAATEDLAAVEAELRETCRALAAADPTAVPVAFWDFDGTLFQGDCSEGFPVSAGGRVAGLVEEAVTAGLSARYRGREGFFQCWEDYQRTMTERGTAEAYAFFVRVFAGASSADLLALARESFDGRLRRWFYDDALRLWSGLEAAGARNFVISASADFFVKGAAAVLGVAPDRLHGVRLTEDAAGALGDGVTAPLTFGEGKAERMRDLLAEMDAAEPDKNFHTIAAFGNHWSTDGPLLEAAARHRPPAGAPLAVLVNAPAPEGAVCRLRCLTFSARPGL